MLREQLNDSRRGLTEAAPPCKLNLSRWPARWPSETAGSPFQRPRVAPVVAVAASAAVAWHQRRRRQRHWGTRGVIESEGIRCVLSDTGVPGGDRGAAPGLT